MIYLKLLILIISIVTIIRVWIKNYKKWATILRKYMIDTQKKTSLSEDITWNKPWTIGLSRALVIFLGFMAAVTVYAALFSNFEP